MSGSTHRCAEMSPIRRGSGACRRQRRQRFIGELIPGGFVGYELAKVVTLGLRAWGTIAFQELSESALIIEPQVRAQLGPVRLALGTLLPMASRFEEPTLIGLRLTAAWF